MAKFNPNWIPAIVLCLLLGAWACIAPLKNALNVGADDKFELCNAQLVERHPEMAVKLQNDQPWLHTLLVARAFVVIGENAAIPRILNLAMTFGLVLACWHLMGGETKPLAKYTFLCIYFTSNDIPTLSTSAMLEPWALSLAVIAVAISFSENELVPKWRGYLAGTMMGFAVFSKLTALIVVVGWLVLLWNQRKTTPLISLVVRVASGFIVTALFTITISPTFSLQSLWLSHWQAHDLISRQTDTSHFFNFQDVLRDWVIFIPVAVGIAIQRRRFNAASAGTWFALAWLLTDFCIHVWHKPWWSYYAIHFQIPIAIIAAQGAAWMIKRAWDAIGARLEHQDATQIVNRKSSYSLSEDVLSNINGICACIIIACWCSIRLSNCMKECEAICTTELAQDSYFIPFIRNYEGRANWIYSNDENIAFFSGILRPPELVLMTYKRLISGDLNKNVIFGLVKSYKPDILLLRIDQELSDERFQKFILDGKYVKVTWSENVELWVSPMLHPTPAKTTLELIKLLKL